MTSQTLLTKEALRPRNIVGNVGPLLLATGIVFAISPAMAQQYVVPVVQQPNRFTQTRPVTSQICRQIVGQLIQLL